MSKLVLNRFLKELSRLQEDSVDIYLTGGMAGLLLGGVRPTHDVDFAFKLPGRVTKKKLQNLEKSIHTASARTRIPAQYSEDIDRWSMIHLGNFRRGAKPYQRLKKCHIKVLHPLPWSVGKLARYHDSDVKDLVAVLQRQKIPWQHCIKYWGQCLRKSPRSSHQWLFINHVKDFLKTMGKQVWGKAFTEQAAFTLFKKTFQQTSSATLTPH